jgi:hypothetical protein
MQKGLRLIYDTKYTFTTAELISKRLNKAVTKREKKIQRKWLNASRMHKTLYKALPQTEDVELPCRLLKLQVAQDRSLEKL